MKKALLFAALGATSANAHPGHEAAVADGALHWITHGDHLAVIILGVVFLWVVLRLRPVDLLRRFLKRE